MSTETECVRQSCIYCTFLGLVKGKVQRVVDFRIVITFFVVDCRRNDILNN